MKQLNKIGNAGQGSVEYILLTLVVIAMTSAVFSNDKFRNFFGKNSTVFIALRDRMEYSYRYCTNKYSTASGNTGYGDKIDSYYNNETSNTRFFTTKQKYPR